jgi:hypothetical protein
MRTVFEIRDSEISSQQSENNTQIGKKMNFNRSVTARSN